MSQHKQPISPHLSVYKWQVTNTLSILHRFSGVILFLAAFDLAIWFVSIVLGEGVYLLVTDLFSSNIAIICWVLCTLAFFYHFLNGIRHLFWDIGKGFENNEVTISGVIVFFSSILLTTTFWFYLLNKVN